MRRLLRIECGPEVEAIYGRFRRRTCEYVSTEKFTNYFVEQFAEHTSEDDLRAAVAFYSTPAGKRIQSMYELFSVKPRAERAACADITKGQLIDGQFVAAHTRSLRARVSVIATLQTDSAPFERITRLREFKACRQLH